MKLTTGLLWLDDTPPKARTFQQKVAMAAARYTQKHGASPTLCHVHPSTLNGHPRRVGPVRIVPLHNVLPHHFWIGRHAC